MRIAMLMMIGVGLSAADPFSSPDVSRAAAAVSAAVDNLSRAQEQYIDATAAAWAASPVRPIPVPKLSDDPRQSERQKIQLAQEYNSTVEILAGQFRILSTIGRGKRSGMESGVLQGIEDLRSVTRKAEDAGLLPKQDPAASVDVLGNPKAKEKAKIRAVLADGTVVEQ